MARSLYGDLLKRPFGVKWAIGLPLLLGEVLGSELMDRLRAAHRQGNLDVIEAQERSEAEIGALLAANRSLRRDQVKFKSVVVGRLTPMPWLDFDLKAKLRDGLMVPLEEFVKQDHSAAKTRTLRTDLRTFDDWKRRLDEAGRVAAAGEAFLTADNLALLARWVPEQMVSRRRAVEEWADSKEVARLRTGLVS